MFRRKVICSSGRATGKCVRGACIRRDTNAHGLALARDQHAYISSHRPRNDLAPNIAFFFNHLIHWSSLYLAFLPLLRCS